MTTSNPNLILVGFMGTGKTSTGLICAQRLNRPFLDMDDELVRRAGKSIPRIFAEDGEPAFRAMEHDLVKELASESGRVIAPGGGIVLNPANIQAFATTGTVICLTATPEWILRRVGNDTNRPLLQVDDKLAKIRELLAARKPLYDAIPLQIDTDGLTPAGAADLVIDQFLKLHPPA
ncbi:MAG TPA: shikimate kinase [Kiritimatiellia bacterium]|nr:shikimate kinase [Kiritimatiellia bacterium]